MSKFIRKNAGSYAEYGAGMVPGIVLGPPVAAISDVAGQLHGALVDPGDSPMKEFAEMDNSLGYAFVPGVTSSRVIRRQRLLHKLLSLNGSDDNIAAHGIAARILNPLNIVARPFAAVAAGLTPGQSPSERANYVRDPNKILKTWLIPGYETYNKWKDVGLTNRLGDVKGTIAKLRAEGKDAEAAEYAKFMKRR